jgi:hypothetical protein
MGGSAGVTVGVGIGSVVIGAAVGVGVGVGVGTGVGVGQGVSVAPEDGGDHPLGGRPSRRFSVRIAMISLPRYPWSTSLRA